ncbi:MAG: hypothetical protein CMC22_00365 [Flavobacteriaceae bacterium]|nr:hypothetical protein [Flavobacteriaceae bacterium]|tara:strand:- start:781 stop:1047 length:267 start_codon:yes stop_codon:yes gene_type:complete
MVLSTNNMGGLISTHLTKGEKMKYLILQDTVANKEKVKAGDIVELSYDEGRSLVGYGKAEEYKGKPKKETNRSVGLKKSETKVKKRSK